jgi:hypothetical protein
MIQVTLYISGTALLYYLHLKHKSFARFTEISNSLCKRLLLYEYVILLLAHIYNCPFSLHV